MDASSDAPAGLPSDSVSHNTMENGARLNATARESAWRSLQQLANLPRTPSRRASSVGPASINRTYRRTPIARTPGPRLGSAKRIATVTPHGIAAQRELNLRRAGFTPAKDRRRSGRQQRETPRDTLRALSQLLAPISQLIPQTPQGSEVQLSGTHRLRVDEWEDGPDPIPPRLSLPLGYEDDEDDSLLLPPRSAGLENEPSTIRSVELGRRAHSEQPQSRLSRGSFGSVRLSGTFSELNELLSDRGDDETSVVDESGISNYYGYDESRG